MNRNAPQDVRLRHTRGAVSTRRHRLLTRSRRRSALPYGGVDAGGTSWTCVIGFGPADVRVTSTFPTTTPAETISRVAEFFLEHGPVAAVGVGSFGPIDLHVQSPTWGHIRRTPKKGWVGANVASALEECLGIPVAFDTDVNAAALGERRWGAATAVETFCFITVGTGIGAGVFVNGTLLHGLLHPEVGHMQVPHDRSRDPFAGSCPYHGDCLEGLASGEAIRRRWGVPGELLDDPAAWDLVADYLSTGIINVISVVSPQLIVLGGGVMKKPGLLSLVRSRVAHIVDGYFSEERFLGGVDAYVVAPGLGSYAGAIGAIELARDLRVA
jgi:fructokinase